MKFLSAIIVAFAMSTQALAGLPPTSTKSQLGTKSTTFDFQAPYNQYTKTAGTAALLETGSYQLLKNPAFEATTYSSNWTASGGTLAAAATTNIFFSKGATWDSSSAAQTLTSDAISVPEGFKGGNCEASMHIKVPSGTATHLLQAWDGTNILVSATVTNSTFFARTTLNFPCPQSGTVALRLVSVAADEPLIAIDDAYLGLARNVGSTQLISEWQSYTPTTAGLGTVASVDFKWRRVGDSMEIQGRLAAGTATAVAATISLPSPYVASSTKLSTGGEIVGSIVVQSTITAVDWYIIGTGGSSNLNIGIKTSTTTGGFTYSNGNAIVNAATDTIGIQASVPIQGWTAQTTASIDAISKRGSISFSTGSATITGALATFNVAGFGTNTLEGQALAPTTANDLGIRMTGAPAGVYEVTAVGKFYASSPATTGTRTVCEFRLYDGTNHSAGAYGIATGAGTYETNDSIANITGLFTLSSAGTINVVVRGQRVAGNGTCYAEAGAYISIKNVSQPSPAIVLANSVSTGTTNGEKIGRATIANSGSASITSQSTGFLSSVNRSSIGTVAIVFTTGYFSAAPSCVCTTYLGGRLCSVTGGGAPTATGVTLTTTDANTASESDRDIYLVCVGPR